MAVGGRKNKGDKYAPGALLCQITHVNKQQRDKSMENNHHPMQWGKVSNTFHL